MAGRGLRAVVADFYRVVSRADRFRAEIIREKIVLSPTRSGKQTGIVRQLQTQLVSNEMPGFTCDQVIGVTAPHLDEDYAVPDLVVLSQRFHQSSQRLALVSDQAVRLVAEVVSRRYGSFAIADKPDWYAEAGVPLFLLVDPRDGSWRLLSQPDSRRYRARVDGVFGEDIVLPEPFDFALRTKEFKRYE